ncbi:MAG: AAA family ATPase [Bacteroidota bacterium]
MDEYQLRAIGTIWSAKDMPANTVVNPQIEEIITAVCGLLTKTNPKSVLITGEKGVGKSTVINLVSKTLTSRNWMIFNASAGNVMAGQRYIGDLEMNVQKVLEGLKTRKNSLWSVPRFQELYYGGRHEYSPVSILDQILPEVESGGLKMIGEIDSKNFEKLVQLRPQVLSAFEIVRISTSTKEFTLDLAQEWVKSDNRKQMWKGFSKKSLEEVYYLAKQYLSHKENPGCLIDLLKQTKVVVEAKGQIKDPIVTEDFIQSLSNITGLPTSILDDKEKLELEELKAHFATKVIGQDDAVSTLVERIAMIKAGLTDPTRPSAVFLFVGPTGTGKTEIAKALAEYLFGSEDRLIRMDMSEFQTQESTYKILGDAADVAENSALVNQIRSNPFSVVLLDEFEKAHPKIWDLFLQVFDDGRLTDQRGANADFRHSIIIMTSNLGASLPSSSRIGFQKTDAVDMEENITESISGTFRPEFINRIDKVVAFKPLSKAVAKNILKNELKKVLKRRGFRRRKWELDLEDSAIEFLLEKGFSTKMGARPLKRAIEKYLLAPLAITIVNHNFPKGDQFLLVSGGKDKLKVEFIDPDEPDYTWQQKKQILASQKEKSQELTITNIIADAQGVSSEFHAIEKALKALNDLVKVKELEENKTQHIEAMSALDFWDNPERQRILSEIEFIDRFEAALETSNNLFNRLDDPSKERLSYDPRLIKKLAQRIYLLNEAFISFEQEIEQDAYLYIAYTKDAEDYGQVIEEMYKGWSKSRKMDLRHIKTVDDTVENSIYFSISGFGAFKILREEAGHHVFEIVENKEEKAKKYKVKVGVLPRKLADYKDLKSSALIKRFDAFDFSSVCRRYKLSKSPLIRDLKKNWQTGKVEKVFGGDFDLMS